MLQNCSQRRKPLLPLQIKFGVSLFRALTGILVDISYCIRARSTGRVRGVNQFTQDLTFDRGREPMTRTLHQGRLGLYRYSFDLDHMSI